MVRLIKRKFVTNVYMSRCCLTLEEFKNGPAKTGPAGPVATALHTYIPLI